MEPEHYDAIVIGAGQAGKPLSIALANAGLRTAIVEREYIGGTCVNFGCTPTKTMVASARVAYLARRASDYGVKTQTVSVNMAEVRKRKQQVVESFREGGLRSIKKTKGLDLIEGDARFVGPKTLEVRLNDDGTRLLTAEKILINTGGRPSVPPIPGLDEIPTLDSTSIMELDELPEHLIVLGGGYIGLEFGQMFRRFGSSVSVIHRGRQLLSREDPDIADEVATILRNDGVEVHLGAEAIRAEKSGSKLSLTVKTADGEATLTGSHILAAIGRRPNTDQMNLEAAGIETDPKGFVKVNERLETNVDSVFAMGDVNGGPQFTHISYDDFRILCINLIEGGNATTKDRLVPYTVFIDPQLGRVGLSETEAREKRLNVRVARLPMENVARAIELGETRGFMKAIVDAETDQILGCAVLGIEGGELMAMFEIAIMGKLPYTKLKDGIFAHPTLAESLNNLFASFDK